MTPEHLILWDVVEEHLEEAGFLNTARLSALNDPEYTLREVADGPEARMLAHLDGLVVAGPVAARRLFAKQLDGFDEDRPEDLVAASAALFLLRDFEPLREVLLSEGCSGRAAVVEGCSLFQDDDFSAWLRDVAQGGAHAPQVLTGLYALAYAHELQLGSTLAGGYESAGLLRAALRLGRYGGVDLSLVEGLIRHEDALVCEEAVITGLHLGSPLAWRSCHELGLAQPRAYPRLLLLTGALGDQAELGALVELVSGPHAAAAFRALGFSGSRSAVPTILSALDHADLRVAKCAGEAFSTITGCEITDDERSLEEPEEAEPPDFEDDDLDADLVPSGEDALLLPDADAVRAWWAQHQDTLDPAERLLGGQRKEPALVLKALSDAPTHRRHLLALELSVRSGGAARLDTYAVTGWQEEQLLRATRTLFPIAPGVGA